MSGFDNEVLYAIGERLEPSSQQAIGLMQKGSSDVSRVNWIGTPEGFVAANPASIDHDPSTGQVYIKRSGTGNTGWLPISTNSQDLHTAKLIVNPSGIVGTGANYSSITSAMANASSGDTIFLMDGIYTENYTAKAGVSLTSFTNYSDTPNVTIIGKCTFTTEGTFNISNIKLQTNGDFFLAVTGAANSGVTLSNCRIACTNNTGISQTSAGSGEIKLFYCFGDISTTGITLFSKSGNGAFSIRGGRYTNSGNSTTASTISAGTLSVSYCDFSSPITTSGTASASLYYINMDTNTTNTTTFTAGGSDTHALFYSRISSGSASAISIGNTCSLYENIISSSNTNAITGAGTVIYSGLTFDSTSSLINTTTQIGKITSFGLLTMGAKVSGVTNTMTVTNPSDTASSQAQVNITVGGTTAGDAYTTYTVAGTTNWSQGVDNSVTGDPFVISASTALGTTNIMSASTSGEINYPLQPAFLATTNLQSDVTGDNTAYTILYANEIFDQGGDFASPSFTAPVTGRYYLAATVPLLGLGIANTTGTCQIVASNRSVLFSDFNWGIVMSASGTCKVAGSILMDMDAGDTVSIAAQIVGGAKIVDIGAGNGTFSGYLAC